MQGRALFVLLGLAWAASAAGNPDASLDEDRVVFFEKKIRPLLVENCFSCHSAETKAQGGLRVDDRRGLLQGGNKGPAVVPGKPEASLLLQRVGHADEKLRMPPRKQLSEAQLADLRRWIAEGAAWPTPSVPASVGRANPRYDQLRREHWAWQPLRDVTPPAVKAQEWPRDDVDRFLLAVLEAQGLAPVSPVDRLTFLRRVTFDLIGLPPTPEEQAAFVNDARPDAFERVVDRLLASPRFGERWGRHWLDLARYAESTGSSRNLPYPQAWRYRDYVIDAFNADLPYDRFVREQIAGDLLPAKSIAERDRHQVATGFLALGVKDVNQRFKVRFVMDNIDEQIDTVSRSILGLTVSCARCHDHKFDPIPTTDYYALAGIFHSTDLLAGLRNKMGGGGLDYFDATLLARLGGDTQAAPPAEKVAELTTQLNQARTEFNAIRGTAEGLAKGPDGFPKQRAYRLRLEKIQSELTALTTAPGEAALGVRDARVVSDIELRIRGEAEKLGPIVPRGYLSVLNVPDAPRLNAGQSGRLELAQWLTSPRNPLTVRVVVNRVWQHLFGAGLVASVDNFGITGEKASHPELLDHLAGRFVREGWSFKKLIRSLVLTQAYQLGSEATPAHLERDPANRLHWRHAPRRLNAEEIRDGMLQAAGQLVLGRPETALSRGLPVVELRNNGPEARKIQDEAQASRYRSVYLPLLRGLTPRSLEVFDFAEQGMVTGKRDDTTVPTQALYLLNDPLVRRQALILAERLLRNDGSDEQRVLLLYRLTLNRPATGHEITRALEHVTEYEKAARTLLPPERAIEVLTVPPTPRPETPAASVVPVDPDNIDPTDAPVVADTIQPRNARTAAWMSLAQAVLGSAEFRYVK